MPQFTYAHAHGADWRSVARTCAERLEGATGNLGFLYATDRVADHLGEILSICRKATSVAHWVGTVGVGICATGHEYLFVANVSLGDPALYERNRFQYHETEEMVCWAAWMDPTRLPSGMALYPLALLDQIIAGRVGPPN